MGTIDEALTQKPDYSIYHYTSQQGLIGILRDRALWCSKPLFLSDATELAYGFQLLKRRLGELESGLGQKETPLLDQLKEMLKSVQDLNFFVGSFSSKGNLLSQWRAYCPKAGGFSIGFNFQDLKPHLDRQGFRLVRCVYNKSLQKIIVDKYAEWAIQTIRTRSKELTNDPDDRFMAWLQLAGPASSIAQRFIPIAALLKDSAFEEEDEWRIVSAAPIKITHEQVDFRPGISFIVPYFKFELAQPSEPVRFADIYVGPTPHPELSRKSVHNLITRVYDQHMDTDFLLNIADKVKLSNIPYRMW